MKRVRKGLRRRVLRTVRDVDGGVTLLELIVALAVSSFVLMAVSVMAMSLARLYGSLSATYAAAGRDSLLERRLQLLAQDSSSVTDIRSPGAGASSELRLTVLPLPAGQPLLAGVVPTDTPFYAVLAAQMKHRSRFSLYLAAMPDGQNGERVLLSLSRNVVSPIDPGEEYVMSAPGATYTGVILLPFPGAGGDGAKRPVGFTAQLYGPGESPSVPKVYLLGDAGYGAGRTSG